MLETLGVVTAVATGTDATSLVGSISENLIANLPFILAIVGFGIVLKNVLRKVNKPLR